MPRASREGANRRSVALLDGAAIAANVQRCAKVGVWRKGIMQGLQVPPNERIEAIRLDHVIDTVVSLYEPIGLLP